MCKKFPVCLRVCYEESSHLLSVDPPAHRVVFNFVGGLGLLLLVASRFSLLVREALSAQPSTRPQSWWFRAAAHQQCINFLA
jgi:hypothetical protein